jgi:uncharacterized protein (TIGR02996 family)
MTDADFLQEILAHAEDDTPRLIYADWLEERGDPRAEFIRVQCELAAMHRYDPRRSELQGRETALLRKHAKRWVAPIRKYVKRYEFRRGFVERVSAAADQFLDAADHLFASAPLLELSLSKTKDHWPRLLACAHLNRIETLSLVSNRLGPRRTVELAACPNLSRVETLKLSTNEMGVSGLRALVESSRLSRLSRLEVNSNELGDEAIVEAASCPGLQRIQHLNLSANDLGVRSLQALVDSEYTSALGALDLRYAQISGEGFRILAGSRRWGNLTRLSVLAFSEADIVHLSAWPLLQNIRVLALGSRLAAAQLKPLLSSASMRNVHKLNLDMSHLGNQGVAMLVNSTAWPGFRDLSLRWNEISQAGVQALVAARKPKLLRHLDLSANLLEGVDRDALARHFGDDVCVTDNTTLENSADLEY